MTMKRTLAGLAGAAGVGALALSMLAFAAPASAAPATPPELTLTDPYACRQDVHPYNLEFPGRFVHVSSITEAPNGDLLYAFYAGQDEFANDKFTTLSRMKRGSATWSELEIIHKTDKIDGNPVIWHDGQGATYLFYSTIEGDGEDWSEAVIDFKISYDSGYTWGEPHALREEWGWNVGTRPLRMSNGEVLLPVYDEVNGSSGWIVSADGFETWDVFPSDSGDWPIPGIQAATVELEDGHLLAYMRTGEGFIYETESFDFGRTWSTAQPTEFPNRGARVDLLKLESGNLLLALNPVNQSDPERSPMRLMLSTDNGETWEHSVDVETNRNERYQYPYLYQTADGFIHLGYTHTRATKNMRSVVFNESFVVSGEDIESNPATGRRQYEGVPIYTTPVEYSGGQFSEVPECGYQTRVLSPDFVQPAAVTFIDVDGTSDDRVIVPESNGIEYLIGDEAIAAGEHPASGTVRVTARALSTYAIDEGATSTWSHTFSDYSEPEKPEPGETTAPGPGTDPGAGTDTGTTRPDRDGKLANTGVDLPLALSLTAFGIGFIGLGIFALRRRLKA